MHGNGIAWIDDVHMISVVLHGESIPSNEGCQPVMYSPEQNRTILTTVHHIEDAHTVELRVHEELPMGKEWRLIWEQIEVPVYPRAVVRTSWFDEYYAIEDVRLGAIYHETETDFSVWAPTATMVCLYVQNQRFTMQRGKRGVWKRVMSGDWAGISYQFEVTVNGQTSLVNDPYAKGLLVNSTASVVINDATTNPPRFLEHVRPVIKPEDAIIYETHIRDATIQRESGVVHRGKYRGLTEKNTTSPNGFSTGLDYMKQLGITHVQLMPMNDFARVDEADDTKGEYNWGYDPLTFQVPEGSYATNAEDPIARIYESKEMIQAFHETNLAVILDVVYNHVFKREASPFEKLVPGYYFRYDEEGNVSNGTGVGNDFASERKMARKFILESIEYWLQAYQIDGFRFDLMGVMDIETMKQIRIRCEASAFPILLLGEGWDLTTALPGEKKAISKHSAKMPGIRFFNDYFRDTLKGDLFAQDSVGYVNGGGHFVERLAHLVTGSTIASYGEPFVSHVTQTVNYVECHDNHTLWDRLCLTNPKVTEPTLKSMHQLATGITLLSQGTPFIHAGQEWFRTKQGDENSYLSGDRINQLDWIKREQEQQSITFMKQLLSIRKKYQVFRLTSEAAIRQYVHILSTPDPIFGYVLLGENENIAIYVNPLASPVQVQLPGSGIWKVIATNKEERKEQQIVGEYVTMNAYEFIVLVKSVHGKRKGSRNKLILLNSNESIYCYSNPDE